MKAVRSCLKLAMMMVALTVPLSCIVPVRGGGPGAAADRPELVPTDYRISKRGNPDHSAFPYAKEQAYPGDDIDHLRLVASFPQCKRTYQNDCGLDEVKIPCSNLCVRVCTAATYWDDETKSCLDIPRQPAFFGSIAKATEGCRQHHRNYRLPTLAEMQSWIGDCWGSKSGHGDLYCAPYASSRLQYLVELDRKSFVVDVPQECTNPYGMRAMDCGWIGKIHYGHQSHPITFSFLNFYGGPKSALADALCVRETNSAR